MLKYFILLYGVFLICSTLQGVSSIRNKVLNFAFFYPRNSPELQQADGGHVGLINYGLNLFNSQQEILPDYYLNFSSFDSGCSQSLGNRAYIDMLMQPKYYLMILGPACSTAAEPVARDTQYTNIQTISYSASSSVLSDTSVYPNFFRVFPSDLTLVQARVQFILNQGWRRIGVITHTDTIFSSTASEVSRRLSEQGISVELFLIVDVVDIKGVVNRIIRESYSVLIGDYYSSFATHFLCEFYKLGIVSPAVTWLLLGWYPEDFWRTNAHITNCTVDELAQAVEYVISFVAYPETNDFEAKTYLGVTTTEFRSIYNQTIAKELLTFDAFTTMVKTLNNYKLKYANLCSTNSTYCLENFNYQNADLANLLHQELQNVSFLGVSGNVLFDSRGDRVANATISQRINAKSRRIATSLIRENIFLPGPNNIMWPDGQTPSDGIINLTNTVSIVQFIIYAISAVLASLLSLFYIFAIIVKIKHVVVLSYRPELTIAMLIGTMILYLFIILDGLQNIASDFTGANLLLQTISYDVVCNVKLWIAVIGFTITYTPIFLRTLESVYITEYKLKRPGGRKTFTLKHWHLWCILGIFLLLDVIWLFLWSAIPVTRLIYQVMTVSGTSDRNVPTLEMIAVCGSNPRAGRIVMTSILIIYKGIIILLGMVFVIDTKDIKFKGLRDSVYIGISVYTLVVFGVIAYGASELPDLKAQIRFGIIASSLLIGLVVTSTLMVLPKLILVAKDWKGEKEYGVEDIIKSTLSSADFADKLQTTVIALEQENVDLKKRVATFESGNKPDFLKKNKLTSPSLIANTNNFKYEGIELQEKELSETIQEKID